MRITAYENANSEMMNYINTVEQLVDKYDSNQKEYAGERLKTENLLVEAELMAATERTRQKIDAYMESVAARAEDMFVDALHVGEAEEDYKLLALPTELTAEELAALIKRNSKNHLFLRSAAKYAQDHKLDMSKHVEAMAYIQQPPYISARDKAKQANAYFTNRFCLTIGSAKRNRNIMRSEWETIWKSKLFDTLSF